MRSLSGHDPAGYRPHALHAGGRTYIETNCYTDVVIELLHASGYEPLAALGFLARMDFEGDQWTFFKPPPEDLELLFGIDIHEMQPYRPLPVQIADQLACGRTVIIELDSFHLPDTASTSYRAEHVKTTVAVDGIEIAGETLRYFHNTGLHELAGEDYRSVFRLGGGFSADVLPPYTEIVRFDAGRRLEGGELREAALLVLRRHLAKRPRMNPFERFGEQLDGVLAGLFAGGVEDYHAYAFATVRMAGAGFELAASHVRWLLGDRGGPVTVAMAEIVDGCTVLGFRLARRRPFDVEPLVAGMASAWTRGIGALEEAVD